MIDTPLKADDRAATSIVVVIPLYNGADFIEQALRSVFNQTLQPDEIVVVNDGSLDDGPAIVQRLAQERPITLINKPNGGQSSARNLGVRQSSSALIALLDQDDIWYSRHLEKLSKPFRKRVGSPVLGWVYSNLDEIDEQGLLVNRRALDPNAAAHPKRRLINCLSEDMYVLPSASLIAREAFESVGGFDERLSGYEDDDLFLRLFRAGYHNIYLDEPLSQWRIYFSSTSYGQRMRASRLIYFEKLCAAFPDDLDRNYFYIKDVLAPRFTLCILAEYDRFSRTGAEERFKGSVRDLRIVARHRRTGPKLALAVLALLSPSAGMGRFVILSQRILARLGLYRLLSTLGVHM